MIGKGNRAPDVIEAMKKYKAIYFGATGGAGALIAKSIKKAEVVAYPELGPEAIMRLEVEDFPAVVINDTKGNDLYVEGAMKYKIKTKQDDSLMNSSVYGAKDMEVISHDVLIFGTGLAGLRAAAEIARKSSDSINSVLSRKFRSSDPILFAPKEEAAAVLREEEGDSFDLHAWDTVKGSDFLADQDVVDRFVEAAPREMMLLEHWGIPWSRRPDGRIQQRPFGGTASTDARWPRIRRVFSRSRLFTTH